MNTDLNKGKFSEEELLSEDYLIIDRRNKDIRVYRDRTPTLRKGNHGLFYIYNKQIYKVNGYQSLLLQGFPKEYIDKAKNAGINPNKLLAQAGNAMTVKTRSLSRPETQLRFATPRKRSAYENDSGLAWS